MEMLRPSRKRVLKSSRSSIRASGQCAARRTVPSVPSASSHSELKRTTVGFGSSTLNTWVL